MGLPFRTLRQDAEKLLDRKAGLQVVDDPQLSRHQLQVGDGHAGGLHLDETSLHMVSQPRPTEVRRINASNGLGQQGDRVQVTPRVTGRRLDALYERIPATIPSKYLKESLPELLLKQLGQFMGPHNPPAQQDITDPAGMLHTCGGKGLVNLFLGH